MEILDLAAILITLAALFSYLNHQFIGLPSTIGLLLIALSMSLLLIITDKLGWHLPEQLAEQVIEGIDFNKTLLQGMLSFLLFAGALHVNLDDLKQQRWVIGILATIGVVCSTFIVGIFTWWMLDLLNLHMDFIYCLLFGALISPTDPIAVLGILKTIGAPKTIETKITGESLFNDGIGVVIFLVLLGILIQGPDQQVTTGEIALLLVEEVVGGAIFGLLLGGIAYFMLKNMDNYSVEILITLALVMGGYSAAIHLHISGPIAMVIAGLLIGNHGRAFAMSDRTREHLDTFWELIDETLNSVLFLLIGLEILLLNFQTGYLPALILIIPLVLFSRFISVGIPIQLLRKFRTFSPNIIKILTWGGLRGGISVALALSLPQGEQRELILLMTFAVVIFSIVVQGLTIGRLIKAK